MAKECGHLLKAAMRSEPVEPSSRGCQECLQLGAEWVHLRLCLECGHVGCCDNSPNRHATRHYHATQHPVIRSFEPGEDWGYCYPDDAFSEALTSFPQEEAPVHFAPP